MKRLLEESVVEGENSTHQGQDIIKKQRRVNMPQHVDENGTPKYSAAQLAHIEPSAFTRSCFRAYGINTHAYEAGQLKDYFLETTEEHMEAYEIDVIQAIRDNDVDFLRAAKKAGRSLQGCNRFGESLIHLACRRSSLEIVQFLVEEGSVSLRVKDDYGRTPLHDVCWRKEPDFALIDVILNEEPDLLIIADNRGHLPLDYARKEHWGLWIRYLAVRMKKEVKRRLS
jgi:hypothetical protein